MKKCQWLGLFFSILFGSGGVQPGLAANCIEGSGVAKSEKRTIEAFTAIDASGAFNVTVVCGEKQRIKVTADDNLLPHIITKVKGNTLKITTNESICAKKVLKVEIAVHNINRIAASGTADIDVSKLDNDRFALDINGAGRVKAVGKTQDFAADLTGASSLQAKGLKTRKTTLQVSGSGEAVVFVSQELNAQVIGVGNITYYGNPEKVNRNILGVGNIQSGD